MIMNQKIRRIMNKNKLTLFDDFDEMQNWKEHWQDMPEFIVGDEKPHQQIIVSFKSKEDVEAFSKLINQKLTYKTKSVWYPKVERLKPSDYEYNVKSKYINKYPICIISKGRAKTCTTHKLFESFGIDYYYMVEPQDYQKYVDIFGQEKVINIKENDKGIYYVRNFCIEWSKNNGHEKHWQIDDDLRGLFFRNMNEVKGFRDREKINNPLKMLFEIESFSDNCTNFGGACLTHDGFAFSKKRDIDLNKMIYCFQLLNNNIQARYQPRTSEDVDFSVRILKENLVTMVFNKYSFSTPSSGSVEGGCNDSIDYINNGRKTRNLKLVETYPEWFTEYEKNGQSEIKPSRIWKTFQQRPIYKND